MDAAIEDEARAVLGTADVVVDPLGHTVVASATAGMWRVTRQDGIGPAASAVVKVLAHAPDAAGNWPTGGDVGHWGYWRREAHAYGSGLLTALPGGLRAPACHLVADRDDGSVALWLEDLRGDPASTWSLGRYETAARHLGRMQGSFLAGRPLPAHPWLSRGWLRAYLGQRDVDLAANRSLLTDRALWAHPVVARWFPDPPIDDAVALLHDQDRYLARLDELPMTLSHLDLHPANLFAGAPDGDSTTVAIDWAYTGLARLGEDPGNLVPDAAFDFHVAPGDLDELFALVVRGYHAGLQEAGATVTTDEVRTGMVAGMAAKYGWIAPAMLRAVADDRALLNRRPLAEAVAAWAPTIAFVLRQAATLDRP